MLSPRKSNCGGRRGGGAGAGGSLGCPPHSPAGCPPHCTASAPVGRPPRPPRTPPRHQTPRKSPGPASGGRVGLPGRTNSEKNVITGSCCLRASPGRTAQLLPVQQHSAAHPTLELRSAACVHPCAGLQPSTAQAIAPSLTLLPACGMPASAGGCPALPVRPRLRCYKHSGPLLTAVAEGCTVSHGDNDRVCASGTPADPGQVLGNFTAGEPGRIQGGFRARILRCRQLVLCSCGATIAPCGGRHHRTSVAGARRARVDPTGCPSIN